MKRRLYFSVLMFLTGTGYGVYAQAEQTGDSVSYAFSGRLMAATPCTISNDQVIDVPFGNVGINKLSSGTQYVRAINYQLDCGEMADTNTLKMILKAEPESWDAMAMMTSVDGLGVRILSDGAPMALNTSVTINPASPPQLQALLVIAPATELTEQPFSATGTLIVEYL